MAINMNLKFISVQTVKIYFLFYFTLWGKFVDSSGYNSENTYKTFNLMTMLLQVILMVV